MDVCAEGSYFVPWDSTKRRKLVISIESRVTRREDYYWKYSNPESETRIVLWISLITRRLFSIRPRIIVLEHRLWFLKNLARVSPALCSACWCAWCRYPNSHPPTSTWVLQAFLPWREDACHRGLQWWCRAARRRFWRWWLWWMRRIRSRRLRGKSLSEDVDLGNWQYQTDHISRGWFIVTVSHITFDSPGHYGSLMLLCCFPRSSWLQREPIKVSPC